MKVKGQKLDEGSCPFCGREWWRMTISHGLGGIMLVHSSPACDHFRRLDADEFYRIAKDGQP